MKAAQTKLGPSEEQQDPVKARLLRREARLLRSYPLALELEKPEDPRFDVLSRL